MGSCHSRQVADLVLLLSEFFFNYLDITLKPMFSRYVDDGFMLTDSANTNLIIHTLSKLYPIQIPITFNTNSHATNYLDLNISLNYFTPLTGQIHCKIFQKPHHKYMYPHFSSHHPKHVFSGLIRTNYPSR